MEKYQMRKLLKNRAWVPGACPSPPEINELGGALKRVFGLSDADLTPLYANPGEYLDDDPDDEEAS